MEQKKAKIVAELQAVKHNSGKSYNQLAEETGLTNVYVAQLLRRQAQLNPQTAPLLRAALPDLPQDLVSEMMRPPLRSYDPNLIQDPTVYRCLFTCHFYLSSYSLCERLDFLLLRWNGFFQYNHDSIRRLLFFFFSIYCILSLSLIASLQFWS